MKLAELMVTDARERGLRHAFGIPGGGLTVDVIESGRVAGLEFVHVAHESSAAIAAAYYGVLKGTAGISFCVKGIGAGNMTGGAVNAYFERVPVVCISDSIASNVGRRELVASCDHSRLFGAVVKYQDTLNRQNAAESLRQAVFQATDGRPGPVLLNVPADFGDADCGPALPAAEAPHPASPDASRLAATLDMVRRARKPVVLAGTDVVRHDAVPELRRLVENIGAAVLVNMDARGVFPETHPRWAGVLVGDYRPGATVESEIVRQSDLVLLAGADPMMSHAPWGFAVPTCELVARDQYDSFSPEPRVRVDGNLKESLAHLADARQLGFSEDETAATCDEVVSHFSRPPEARLAIHDVIEISRGLLLDDGVLLTETGAFIRILEHLWRVDRPGAYLGTSGGRTMGLMIPAALGAKLAQPEVPMMGLGADGSLLMRLGELEAFARTGAALPLVIINDQALGTIKSRQKSRGMPDHALRFHPVDFARIAQACGLNGVTVETPEAFESALKSAFQAGRATLIDVRVDVQPYHDTFGPSIGDLPPPRPS